MNTLPPAPPTAQPYVGEENLTGRILRARVLKTSLDHCDLALLDPETGQEYKTRGRLYQPESLAWKAPALLGELPAYQPSTPEHPVELPAVYVRHSRGEGQEKLWFVHERWGANNPWANLPLQEGDLVYGTVSHEVISKKTSEVAGYLVQLDVDGPLRTLDGEADESGDPDVKQPDIEVYLPVAELPWADGTVGGEPARAGTKHMPLVKGDRVQARLLDIRLPPENPNASFNRLIHYRDAHSQAMQERRETGARLRFHLLWGGRRDVAMVMLPDHPPLHGIRLLLVDDDERALQAYADLYRLNGAEVATVTVERDRFGMACDNVLNLLADETFDLVMVDNNLPGQGLGERMVELASRRLSAAAKPLPRFLLLTANPLDARTTTVKRLKLQGMGVAGFLHRPLLHDTLRRLLKGETVWEEDAPQQSLAAESHTQAAETGHTLDNLLEGIAALPEVRFAMLLRIDPDLPASECLVAGSAPFMRADLKSVLVGTDLLLLAEGRAWQLRLKPDEGGNAELRAKPRDPALWDAFEINGERWILGVGHARGWDPAPFWPWWREALAARLEARSWLARAHESSSFVELGMAHQGLCHEVFNLRNEMDALLTTGEAWVRQPDRDPAFLPELLGKLKRAHQDTLELAEHLLEGLSHRQSHVFLPAALATVRSIVNAECEAKNLTLDIGPAPPIALPIPSAALVLPLVNLLLNAAKHHYRQENRRVSLVLDVERPQGRALLRADVRDNGPGLSVAARARLWQPGHSFAADQEQRHGMGLWLSRRLAEEAGGHLECVEDWRYLGSHFQLSFPIEL